ncbi:sulfurtransferase-like selenium metabolism protein YedF [Clostridioides difficile]|uniref:sulfurtransferase-like selenium metabolism protein YedF n=1 Tax=Clostridioides difficile TaxID=1496 RepID=UPI001FADB066|nr:sulfurtransferase-like selenium metabolism protein YedF [Clostridioides difficile]MCJ0224958.1 sulfurtransferase-like selenium metabolism protein YedF [Clostridioides difficile]MCJ0428122.1 sulfurtransferase-like selenium metabolism protein YedF [Clostridioides difficile]MCJ0435155.1 sulfurtransferase-like selenium metabolism protein YedF [Clostridioides difficile]MCU6149462.1 sulfurtransferase-like selenium metabolism protein YedF [Clostridioides difficile]
MSIKIDARGLACPKPVINTKRELDNLEEGVVVTIVDNETAKENILKLAKSLNCEANIVDEKENFISIEIRKGKNILDKQNVVDNKESELDNTCIFISSDKMGLGNDELGKVLIKGFIYTLTESKPYPKYVLLVNGGVKLSAENEETIENLKILENMGVEVLSCGTCLDYYNLKDKLQVGTVTNMYTIVETLKNASNTISI